MFFKLELTFTDTSLDRYFGFVETRKSRAIFVVQYDYFRNILACNAGVFWRRLGIFVIIRTVSVSNKTHICVNLGLFSGISSCERQNFDMIKFQLSFVDCVTASRRFGQKIPELLPEN